MNILSLYKNIKFLCDKKELIRLYWILFGMIIVSFLELVGIGSIPIFAMIILDPEILVKNSNGLITSQFIENIGKNNFIVYSSIILASIFLFKNIFIGILQYFRSRLMLELKVNLTSKLFSCYLGAPFLFHVNNNPSTLIRNLHEVIANSLRSVESFLSISLEILIFLIIILLLLKVDYVTTLSIFFILGSFAVFFYLKLKQRVRDWGATTQEYQGEELKIIAQSLGSIKEIKILGRENMQFNKFQGVVHKIGQMSFYQGIINSIPRLALEVISIFMIILVCVIYINKGYGVNTIIPVISLFAVAAVRMIPSLNIISISLSSIRFQGPYLETLVQEFEKLKQNNFFEQKKEILNNNDIFLKPLNKNELILNNIKFGYSEKKLRALDKISFSISLGETIGIIGPSGSGKTTLINIILGLIEPDSGDIKLNNINIFDNLKEWRSSIGYVPQDTYLTDASIKENIAFGINEEKIDLKKVNDAISIAQISDLISELPKGIETIVGDRGVKLSGGQRQRIGIARALYHNPSILILDEATSNLDITNENKIIEEINLTQKNRTIIIVSHRKNTVKYCNNIFLMKEGKLSELGKYEIIKDSYDDFFSENN